MNICANFDILFYLSHPRNKYAEQTLFEINTMLYLAELLSIYDGCNAQNGDTDLHEINMALL